MRCDPGSITAGSDGPLPTGARSDRERERSDRQRDCGAVVVAVRCAYYTLHLRESNPKSGDLW